MTYCDNQQAAPREDIVPDPGAALFTPAKGHRSQVKSEKLSQARGGVRTDVKWHPGHRRDVRRIRGNPNER